MATINDLQAALQRGTPIFNGGSNAPRTGPLGTPQFRQDSITDANRQPPGRMPQVDILGQLRKQRTGAVNTPQQLGGVGISGGPGFQNQGGMPSINNPTSENNQFSQGSSS